MEYHSSIIFVHHQLYLHICPSLINIYTSLIGVGVWNVPHSFESVGALSRCVRGKRQKWRHLETSITRLARQPQTRRGLVSHWISLGSEGEKGGVFLKVLWWGIVHNLCSFVNWSHIPGTHPILIRLLPTLHHIGWSEVEDDYPG